MNGPESASLGSAIRQVREIHGWSLRGTARQAGIEASQLSRIENGAIHSPELATLQAVARALGRLTLPLQHLSSPEIGLGTYLIDATWDDAQRFPHLRARWAELEAWRSTGDIPTDVDQHKARQLLDRYAVDVFVHVTVGNLIEASSSWSDELEFYEIDPLLTEWRALTPERRQLALRFISEQAVLSDLDRRGANPARFPAVRSPREETQ